MKIQVDEGELNHIIEGLDCMLEEEPDLISIGVLRNKLTKHRGIYQDLKEREI